MTIHCPFECLYLGDSRAHEKVERDPSTLPHRDFELSEAFLRHADLTIMLFGAFLNKAARPLPNLTDAEMRAALEAMVQRFKKVDVPALDGPAAQVFESFEQSYGKFHSDLAKEQGADSVFNERTLLGVVIFLARMAHGHNNGKPHCRAFVHYLRATFPAADAPE
ncbi:MAG: hypothetical protein FJW30_23335 [Acidobacteria bacterium]|nr:hypothetical protein [Acidobacteriota bacterium]